MDEARCVSKIPGRVEVGISDGYRRGYLGMGIVRGGGYRGKVGIGLMGLGIGEVGRGK